jgi:hypothetical protein
VNLKKGSVAFSKEKIKQYLFTKSQIKAASQTKSGRVGLGANATALLHSLQQDLNQQCHQ